MSGGWIENTVVKKTRKEHQCAYCSRTIPKGSPNIPHWKYSMDGEIQNSYACHWCDEHSEHLNDGCDEIADFADCVDEYFYGQLPAHYGFYKTDGDYLVFRDNDEDKEDVRIFAPIIQKEVK